MNRFEFARKSGFFFLANNVSSIVQYIFQMVMARKLTGDQFAWMNALLSMISLLGVPLAAIQMDLARRTALATQAGDIPLGIQMVRRTILKILPWFALVALGMFLLRGRIALFFNASDEGAVGLAALGILISSLGLASMGFFSGMQWFQFLGIMGFSMAVARLFLGWIFVSWGWGAGGGVLATYLINLIPLFCMAWVAWPLRSKIPAATATPSDHGIFWMALLVIGVNSVLTNLDLVMVKHYLPEGAPSFALAGIFGRAMVFFLGPLGMALVPMSSIQSARKNGDRHRLFWQCLKLCLFLGVIAATFGDLLARPVLMIFKGQVPMETVRLLRLYLWAMFPMAMVTVAMNHVAALKSWRMASQTALLTLIFPLGLMGWHGTLHRVLAVDFTCGAVILVALLFQLRPPAKSLCPSA